MEHIVAAKTGHVVVRTARRADNRWASEYCVVPKHGSPSSWQSACASEGFISEGMALSAAIMLGKQAAEEVAEAR
jgi:hypothetical protein